MPSYRETKILPYSSRQLYDLVVDVAAYPEFLPWCVAARVQSSSDVKQVADLVIGFAVFRERFTSENTLDPEALTVNTRLVKGPFKHLSNHWKFVDAGDGQTEVDFAVEFEFRSKMLTRALEPMFGQAQRKVIAGFESRAREIYG